MVIKHPDLSATWSSTWWKMTSSQNKCINQLHGENMWQYTGWLHISL